MSPLEKAFRELREQWFYSHLQWHAHERQWEDEEHQKMREESNAKRKAKYDAETELIIKGESTLVAPTCDADMDEEE